MNNEDIFEIYTDGACSKNPGKGAYSFIILHRDEVVYKYSEGFILTTNNRMELLAVISAIKFLKSKFKPDKINVYSDSKYVTEAFNENWIENWIKKDFKKVKNTDLWKEYLSITDGLNISFTWIGGHKGIKYNEECDMLAVNCIKNGNLKKDNFYCE